MLSFFFNILTISKAFDSIPDFANLGYQVEKLTYFKNFNVLHKPTTIKIIPTYISPTN